MIPRPRPEIMGTLRPAAARAGASTRLTWTQDQSQLLLPHSFITLSPTPPVLCLSSTRCLHSSGHSRLTPLSTMALVSQAVSWGLEIRICYDTVIMMC